MVRAPCFDKNGIKKGAWSTEEDNKLRAYIQIHGHSNWRELPKLAGLSRCGKSCRLRWMNYLRPNMKRGKFSKQEEDVIVGLHKKFGNKWSMMAAQLPGRSDNEIKNHWHTHLKNRNEKDQSVSKTNKQVGSVDQSVSKANFTAGRDCEQVKEPNLNKSQQEVEILLAVLSSELPSASESSSSSYSTSTSTSGDQVSECSLSVSDYGVPCEDYYVTPQLISEIGENLWFEEFLVDNSLISNTNSLQDQIMDDVHLWSTMDLYY